MTGTIRAVGGWFLLAALGWGCQDYGYEEVPQTILPGGLEIIEVPVSHDADILFLVDNSGSMAGEQAQLGKSFEAFQKKLDENFGPNRYRIAVATTGLESPGCPACDAVPGGRSCINETGENGRFQDRLGCIFENGACQSEPGGDTPAFDFITDNSCRIVNSQNKNCFYDSDTLRGTVMAGVSGCGYERGLAAARKALQYNLLQTYNSGFFQEDAVLIVVIVSDEEDCGEVGDVPENTTASADVCYYAAKGIGPHGESADPATGKPYRLTPVKDYFDFLMSLKQNRRGMVKFAAIVGIGDAARPQDTSIEYDERPGAPGQFTIRSACTTPPPCASAAGYCEAKPGTRYVELFQLFHEASPDDALIDTICQNDFSKTVEKVATFIHCPEYFQLRNQILDPALTSVSLNGAFVPRYSCATADAIIECRGPSDTAACPAGIPCVETWSYCPPGTHPEKHMGGPVTCEPGAPTCEFCPGGTIAFADHYDPCLFIKEGWIRIRIVYALHP